MNAGILSVGCLMALTMGRPDMPSLWIFGGNRTALVSSQQDRVSYMQCSTSPFSSILPRVSVISLSGLNSAFCKTTHQLSSAIYDYLSRTTTIDSLSTFFTIMSSRDGRTALLSLLWLHVTYICIVAEIVDLRYRTASLRFCFTPPGPKYL